MSNEKASSNRDIEYACTKCGAKKQREKLTARRVIFMTIGLKGKQLRSRTTDWLCEKCRNEDPAWNQKALDTPGFRDVKDASA